MAEHLGIKGYPVRGWRPEREEERQFQRAVTAALYGGIALVLLTLLLLPMTSGTDDVRYEMSTPVTSQTVTVCTLPEGIREGLPEQCAVQTRTYTMQQLLAGHMLLVDENHPIPPDTPIAGTFHVLQYAGGRVNCRDSQAVLGKDTLNALEALFDDARRAGTNRLTVFAGTRSAEQQRLLLTDTLAALARDMSLEEALAEAVRQVASPGCSEHQLAWSVDIRLCDNWLSPPDDAPLEDTPDGRWLIANCWRYGLIRRWADVSVDNADRAYHFRYVGKAHAAMMHVLDLPMEDYLTFLHEHDTLTLYDKDGKACYTVVCVPTGERETALQLPLPATVEDVSFDNLGYAIAACIH